MYIYNDNALCVHVSSLFNWDINGTGDWVEIGWVDADTGYHPPGCANGNGSGNFVGDDTPHLFYTWTNASIYNCIVLGTLTSGQSNGFSQKDQDGNDTWTLVHSSLSVATLDLDFSYSKSYTNAERHNSTESARALFDGLNYMKLNTGWMPWADSVCAVSIGNSDPVYNNQLLSATKVQVSTNPSQGC